MTKATGNTYHYAAVFRYLGFKWQADQMAWVAEQAIPEQDINKLKAIRGVVISVDDKPVSTAKPKQSKEDAKMIAMLAKLRAENAKLKQETETV